MRPTAALALLFLALVAPGQEPKAKVPATPPTVEQRVLSLELKVELLRREVADLRDALAELAGKKGKQPAPAAPAPAFREQNYARPPYYSGGVWY